MKYKIWLYEHRQTILKTLFIVLIIVGLAGFYWHRHIHRHVITKSAPTYDLGSTSSELAVNFYRQYSLHQNNKTATDALVNTYGTRKLKATYASDLKDHHSLVCFDVLKTNSGVTIVNSEPFGSGTIYSLGYMINGQLRDTGIQIQIINTVGHDQVDNIACPLDTGHFSPSTKK